MSVTRAVWIAVIGLVLSANAQARVLLLASEDSTLYHEFRAGFEAVMEGSEGAPEIRYLAVEEYTPEAGAISERLVIAAGVEAAKQLAALKTGDVRVLYTMLPLTSYEWLRDNDMLVKDHEVILVDQPPSRFINLIRVALPKINSLGFLYGEVSAEHTQQLTAAAVRHQFNLQLIALHDDRRLTHILKAAVRDNDAILVLPDPYLFNRRAIQALLLASLRGRKPLIAYSESYVQAGALLALYSAPQQLGRQSAERVLCYLSDCAEVADQQRYPRYFTVELNAAIARQLGLSVPPVDTIQRRLEALESEPTP